MEYSAYSIKMVFLFELFCIISHFFSLPKRVFDFLEYLHLHEIQEKPQTRRLRIFLHKIFILNFGHRMNLIIFNFFLAIFLIFPPPNLAFPYPKRGGLPFPLFGFRQQPIRFGNDFGNPNRNSPINNRQFQHPNGGIKINFN